MSLHKSEYLSRCETLLCSELASMISGFIWEKWVEDEAKNWDFEKKLRFCFFLFFQQSKDKFEMFKWLICLKYAPWYLLKW